MSTQLPTLPPDDLLDAALRHELRWEAPPELTNRLLHLVPGAVPIATTDIVPLPRWRLYVAIALMSLLILVSIPGASYLYQLIWFQWGFAQFIAQFEALPARLLQTFYETLPFARELVIIIALIRDQLHWLLIALVLWIILDNWQPERRLVRQESK